MTKDVFRNGKSAEPSRALTVLESPFRTESPLSPAPRPMAVFLSQLIACKTDAVAFRHRRRASPDEAQAVYRMVLNSGEKEPIHGFARMI